MDNSFDCNKTITIEPLIFSVLHYLHYTGYCITLFLYMYYIISTLLSNPPKSTTSLHVAVFYVSKNQKLRGDVLIKKNLYVSH